MRKILLSVVMIAVGLSADVASAHGQFKKALTTKYGFKKIGGVSCYTCHVKGKDPATGKAFTREFRNDFGKLFIPVLKKDIGDRAETSAALKKAAFAADTEAQEEKLKAEAAVIDAGVTKDFLEALKRLRP